MDESRRSARIPGRFWVAVEGVDAEPVLRHGDISATGLFFELTEDIGDVGTVQFLHLASVDRARHVAVMAHVVRVVTLADIHEERRGVALEFMPESDESAANLVDFVRHVLSEPVDGAPPHITSPRVEARASSTAYVEERSPSPGRVALRQLSVQTLLLEADFAVPVGDPVRIEIIAKGVRRPIRVEGEAVSVLPAVRPAEADGVPKDKRYRIAVRVREELPGPLRRFSSKAMPAVDPKALMQKPAEPPPESPFEQLLSSLIQPPAEPPERHHLSGSLARIPFTTLCSLLELERLSGVLTVRRGASAHALFVKEGRFVDLEPTTSSAREEVKKLMAAREGDFELRVGEVDRSDRVGATMTQLLLDLARESDEESAQR